MEVLTRRSLERFSEVRLVTDETNEILPLEQALSLAYSQDLDLVMMSDKSDPPVCRIHDFKKVLYEQNKKKKQQKHPVVKEIQLKPNISDHDLEIKVSQIRKFIDHGDKVKVFVRLKGREKQFPERSFQLLDKVSGAVGVKRTEAGFAGMLLEK